jgi:hypothetical protein
MATPPPSECPDDARVLVAQHAEQVADGAGIGAQRVVTAGLRGSPVAEEIWRDDV